LAANLFVYYMKHVINFLVILLTACDCTQTVRGIVVDAKTNKPLNNISVYNKEKDWSKTETDSSGKFELSNVSGGITCPPMIIVIKNEQYKKVEISISSGGYETIKLEKIVSPKSNFIDYKDALKNIRRIYENFIVDVDGIDGDDNKKKMTQCLDNLNLVTNQKDLELLVNVWYYYDPTDYSCKDLVLKVLLQNKNESIGIVKNKLKKIKKSDDALYTDYNYLLSLLEKK